MNNRITAIRDLAKGNTPDYDIWDTLYKHNCTYLLSKTQNPYTNKIKIENLLNKLYVSERFKTCREIFNKLEKSNIPYAVIKGAVLSSAAYKDPFCRRSGDIDLLIDRTHIDTVKSILKSVGFVQGKITQKGIELFSRKELLFQTAMTHQTAPFIKKTDNKLCPYINVDINLDIMWGESGCVTDMSYVLNYTENHTLCNTVFKKLHPEMELISLCLHHYKDLNSIYLLYSRGFKLSYFSDIYFYIKNCDLNKTVLKQHCEKLKVKPYVYYCLYYTNLIFEDDDLQDLMTILYTKDVLEIIESYGLTYSERKQWTIPFFDRLFNDNLRAYLQKVLTDKDIQKINTNLQFM